MKDIGRAGRVGVKGLPTLSLWGEIGKVWKYLDIAGVAFVAIDANQEVSLINKKGCEILGYEEKEIVGSNWFDTVVPERFRDRVRAVFNKLMAGSIDLAGYFENPALTKSGEERPVVWHNTVLTDEAGNIIGVLSCGEDITERRRVELQYRLASLLSELDPTPILCFDKTGRVLMANRAALETLGSGSVSGMTLSSILPVVYEFDPATCICDGTSGSYSLRVGDRFFRFVFRGVPELGIGHIHGSDITERRQMEKEIAEYGELNELKSNLLSTVSHELRTPLATIKGYSTMLLDYNTRLGRDEKRDYLRSIDRAADRLTELVDNLLKMSRLDAGLLEMEKAPASISKLVREAVAEARVRAPGHRIEVKLAKRLPGVNIDARRIREVLDNILDNAIKYSEEGTGVVVQVWQQESELLISVSDQGVGIPAGELERVFDRMYRIEQRLTPEKGGIGLGLAICKGLVDAHGGRIWMESKRGKGSSCWFTLPL